MIDAMAGNTVLIIGDSPAEIAFISTIMVDSGYIVRQLCVNEQTVTLETESPPQLILMKMRMAKRSSLDICQQIRKNELTATVPIIFIISADDHDGRAEVFRQQPADYLTSPLLAEELQVKAALHLAQKWKAEELHAQHYDLQQKLQLLTEAEIIAKIGGWEFVTDSGHLTWSDGIYRIHEVDKDFELSIAAAINFYTPECRPLISLALKRAIEQGEPFDLELEIVTAQGNRKWVHAIGHRRKQVGHCDKVAGVFQDISEQKRMKDFNAYLASISSTVGDKDFFVELAEMLARSLDMEYVCINRLEGDGLNATTLAIWHEGTIEDNITYALEDTPCGSLVGKHVCCFPEKVCELFPNDQALHAISANSYIGVTLWSHDNHPIGLIAVIGHHPLRNPFQAETILRLAGVRAAAELERLNAETALRINEERYRLLAENATDVIWVMDVENETFSYVSPSVERLLGYSAAAFKQMTLRQVVSDESWNYLQTIIPLRLETFHAGYNDRFSDEIEQVHSDGHLVWVEVSYRLLINPISGRCEATGVSRDITERKKVVSRLTESLAEAQLFREALDNISSFIYMKNLQRRFIYANQPMLDFIACSADEMFGSDDARFFPTETVKILQETDLLALSGRRTTDELTFSNPVGIKRHFLESKTPIYSQQDNKTICGLLGIATDITELRQSEEALQRAHQRLRCFVDANIFGVIIATATGRIIDANDYYLRLIGYTRQELEEDNINWRAITPPEWLPADERAIRELRERGTCTPYEKEYFCKNGGRVMVLLADTLITEEEDQIIALVIDITERKQMETLHSFLAMISSTTMDIGFFTEVARYLSTSLEMDFVSIDRLAEDGRTAQSLAIWCNGKQDFNETYDLSGSSCGYLTGASICCFPENAYRFFPEDTRLQQLRGESYIGVTLWDHDGKPIGLISVIDSKPLHNRSLTEVVLKQVALRVAAELERLDAEAALRKSRDYLKTALANMSDAVAITDGSGNFIQVNDAFTVFHRFTHSGEWSRKLSEYPDFIEILTDDGVLLPFEHWPVARALNGVVSTNCEYTFRRTDTGESWDGTCSFSPIRDAAGLIVGSVFVCRDITDKKKAEEQIARSEAEFRRLTMEFHGLLDAIPDCLMLVDRDLKVLWLNKATVDMLDLRATTPSDYFCHSIWHNKTSPCDTCPALITFVTGTAHNEVVTKEDGTIWDIRSVPLTDEMGRVVNVIMLNRNITEHRKLENQLRQSQKMESIGTLAGGIAHDFNNILTVISGYGQIALLKIAGDDPLRHLIDCMLEGVERATGLTQELLLFSRKKETDKRSVDISDVIVRLQKFLKKVISEEITLTTALNEMPIMVMADEHQIEQVLMNLVTNAIDSMPKGGEITITTGTFALDSEFRAIHGYGKPGNYGCLTVTDTGVGMDEATRQRIFEPFFTTKEVGKGTGLGLAVVYGIVKQHDGYINVYSEPDKGTTFKIYLPIKESTTAEVFKAEELAAIVSGSETILLAEDDDMVRNMTQSFLCEHGYTVIEAVDGIDALAKFTEHKDAIDLLLFDLIMPKMNGKEAFDEIRKIAPKMKAIFSSGYAPETIKQKLSSTDGVHLISKPITPHNLLREIRRLLDAVP